MNRTDIISLIKNDHRVVKELFNRIEKSSPRASKTRTNLYKELREALLKHSHAEEKALYPRLKEHAKTKDIAFESVEEHGVVSYLLKMIDATPADSDEWTALTAVLRETIEHHVDEEEGIMFSKMGKIFSKDDLEVMGQEFEKSKRSWIETLTEAVLGPVEPSLLGNVA